MMIADRLKMSVARAKRETSCSGYLRWIAFIEEDQKARKTEEHYLAQIAFEIQLLRAMSFSGKDRNGNDIEFPFRSFGEYYFPPLEEVAVKEEKPREYTEEEYQQGLATSKAIWGARLKGIKKKKAPPGKKK